jgi:hypothetical protein
MNKPLNELSNAKMTDYENKVRSDSRTWKDLDYTHRKLRNQTAGLKRVAKKLGNTPEPQKDIAFTFKEEPTQPIKDSKWKARMQTVYPGDPSKVNTANAGASKKLTEHLRNLVSEDYYVPTEPHTIPSKGNPLPMAKRDDVVTDHTGNISSVTPAISGLAKDHLDKMTTVSHGTVTKDYPDPYTTKAMDSNQGTAQGTNAKHKIGSDVDDTWSMGAAIDAHALEGHLAADPELSAHVDSELNGMKEELETSWKPLNEEETTSASVLSVQGLISRLAGTKSRPATNADQAQERQNKAAYLKGLITKKKQEQANVGQ